MAETGPIVHVLQPFCRQGNTLVTVAAGLSKAFAHRGGRSIAILSDTRDVSVPYAEGVYVDYTRHCPREWFTKQELLIDYGLARLGMSRPYLSRLYIPAVEAAATLNPTLILLYEGYYALPSLPRWRQDVDGKIVLYAHNPFSRSYSRSELRRSLRNADGVVCVSSALEQALRSRIASPPCPVEVVHNGVDTDVFKFDGRRPKNPDEPFRVLFVGAVSPHKGPDLLLAAVGNAVRNSRLPIRVTIVGSAAYDASDTLSPYEIHLREMARELSLDARFVPFVAHHELPSYYQDADVICVPSVFEDPYPLVIQEAMACGTPVIASGRGGTREAGGKWAIYVDPNDTEEFANALLRMARNVDDILDRIQGGRDWAVQHSWSAVLEQLVGIV